MPDEIETQPPAPERVLIVEDDPSTRVGLSELVQAWGFQTDEAGDGEDAMRKVTTFRPAIIVSDLVMPRMGGADLLRALKDQLSDITFILLTAQGTVESAVEAIKEGAYDYLSKPVDPQRLQILLQKAVERQETLREVRHLRRQLREQGSFGRIIGNSPGIRKVYRIIEQSAPTGASVLISGESGTGKELIAQTIHELSPRASFPFVAINCAAIPETLLESEIFGHEKGAFTGASDRRTGVFELAHRGTLFLDEIAEMMPATQVKLLRVLQERVFRRLGGRQEIAVDVRVIAATNVNRTRRSRPGSCARTSTIGSTSSPSICRRCASGVRTSRCSCRASSRSSIERTARGFAPWTRTRCTFSSTTPGRATSASCGTSSNARRFSPRANSSSRAICRRRCSSAARSRCRR
jgi:DNA-binding NtrC family response regulator